MPIIRNPFRRAAGDHVADENARSNGSPAVSRTSSDIKPLDIKTEGPEYKLSEISDNGVYLPPSPTEKTSFWSARSSRSGQSRQSSYRNTLDENEPFNISRESFDSYRRSFDISARSPVIEASPSMRPRQSLDVRNMRLPSSHSFSRQESFTSSTATTPSLNQKPSYSFPRFHTPSTEASSTKPQPTTTSPKTIQINAPSSQPEEPIEEHPEHADKFEEVGLNDTKPKRHGIFARFGGGSTTPAEPQQVETNKSSSGGLMMGHSFFGRKRGQSGQGAELGAMGKPGARPMSSGKAGASPAAAAPTIAATAPATPLTPSTPSRTQTPTPTTAIAPPPPSETA